MIENTLLQLPSMLVLAVSEMGSLSGREWKALLVLSIVVPVGLLVTFRLTGVLKEPAKIENITLETVEYTFARPDRDVTIDERLDSMHSDVEVSANTFVLMGHYGESDPASSYSDWVTIRIEAGITLKGSGFVQGFEAVLNPDSPQSEIDWLELHFALANLSRVRTAQGHSALVKLVGVNQPSTIHFTAVLTWYLYGPKNQSHQMEVVCETTYFNGTVYKRLVQPFRLTLDASRHILEVKGVFEANPEANVTVWVDGAEYHTPFRIVVEGGVHNISFQPSVQTDSVIREFQYITVNRNRFEYTPDVALDVHGDKLLEAYYR
jgi:hypothetical protein